MKNATASPAYSAEQMQDIRRRLLRAEEQRDAKAAALDALVEALGQPLYTRALGHDPRPEQWEAIMDAFKAAKAAQVSK